MENKKKRVRPTWAMVRDLEAKLSESDKKKLEWIELYKQSLDKISVLDKSNRLMEEELSRVREQLEIQRKDNNKNLVKLQTLKHRGFWARLLNKE